MQKILLRKVSLKYLYPLHLPRQPKRRKVALLMLFYQKMHIPKFEVLTRTSDIEIMRPKRRPCCNPKEDSKAKSRASSSLLQTRKRTSIAKKPGWSRRCRNIGRRMTSLKQRWLRDERRIKGLKRHCLRLTLARKKNCSLSESLC